jgi:secreted PhoX family phosphatase
MAINLSRRGGRTFLPVLTVGQADRCRWACGKDCAHEPRNRSSNETFADVVERAFSRRGFLKASGGALVIAAAATRPAAAQTSGGPLGFTPIAPNSDDAVTVPDGYASGVIIRWGDPILPGAPDFDFDDQTAEAQAGQFGYNCDYLAFFPLDGSASGLLTVNHEYTNPELMFAGYLDHTPTKAQIDVELAAHGMSIVQIDRDGDGGYAYVRDSEFNRRLTAHTPMELTGPAAGSSWMQTSEDPDGTTVLGTLNNCAGGVTPWGTVLSGEENFNQYFANADLVTDPVIAANHERLGLPEGGSDRHWERYHARFDLAREPNEPFRFGWVVEIDPYDPEFTPKKRTALGRFKHEGAETTLAADGRAVAYLGDDERFEYLYKFVSKDAFRKGDQKHNLGLLDSGTLYVAKINDDFTGTWMPLVHGEGPLTEANGFTSQADVLVNARVAGDLLGATKMDRPEDVERNPVTGAVYVLLTNNTDRTGAEVDEANPRADNRFGHVIELREAGDDATATEFEWEIFLLCGNPEDPDTFFAGFPKDQVSPIGSPDNCAFDLAGNLWLATDGEQPLETNDGFFAVPVEGEERGHVQLFLTVPPGAEACGPLFNPDNTAMFCAVQHPGQGSTLDAPISTFPDGAAPNPSVVAVWKTEGGVIGT